jgi:hypothetical protein
MKRLAALAGHHHRPSDRAAVPQIGVEIREPQGPLAFSRDTDEPLAYRDLRADDLALVPEARDREEPLSLLVEEQHHEMLEAESAAKRIEQRAEQAVEVARHPQPLRHLQ